MKIYKDLDFVNKGRIQNAILNPKASDPPSPVAWSPWFNTTEGVLKYFDGDNVQTLGLGDDLLRITANEFIPAGRAVTLTVGSEAILADPDESIRRGFFGFSVGSAAAGEGLVIQTGEVFNSTELGLVSTGRLVFVTSMGRVSSLIPASGARIIVGRGVGVNSVLVHTTGLVVV